jgi:hypothetical protein
VVPRKQTGAGRPFRKQQIVDLCVSRLVLGNATENISPAAIQLFG